MGGAPVTDDWSVAADEDPEAVVAIANPASVSVTSCLRITVGSSPVLYPVTEILFSDPPVSVLLTGNPRSSRAVPRLETAGGGRGINMLRAFPAARMVLVRATGYRSLPFPFLRPALLRYDS